MTGTKCEVVLKKSQKISTMKNFAKWCAFACGITGGRSIVVNPKHHMFVQFDPHGGARYLTLEIPTIWFCKWLYISEVVQYIYHWCSSFTDASMKVRFSGKWGKSPLSFDWWHWFIVILPNLIKFRFHIIVFYQT